MAGGVVGRRTGVRTDVAALVVIKIMAGRWAV